MRWRRTLLGTVIALCAFLILGACSEKQSGTGSIFPEGIIGPYVVHYTLNSDGSMGVDIDFDYQLPDKGGHGPVLRIPEQVATDDPKVDRLYPLSDITASSPTAPANVRTKTKHGRTTIYIGDAATKITGKHTYHVSYTQRGVINHVGNHDEFYWNVLDVHDFWITRVSVVVTAPAKASEVSCYSGEKGSKGTCTESTARIADGGQSSVEDHGWDAGKIGDAGFYDSAVPAEEYLTIKASYPAGTFPQSPVLTADPRERSALEWDESTISIAVGIAAFVLMIIGVRATRPLRRDAQGDQGELGAAVQDAPARKRTTPPDGLHAGEVTTLTTARFDKDDVSVMLLDLASRGALTIAADAPEDAASTADAEMVEGPNWRFTRTGAQVPLTAAEDLLMAGIFEQSDSVTLAGISKRLPKLASKVGAQMLRDVSARGWFKVSLGWSRWVPWVFVGCVLAFVAAMIGAGWAGEQGWLGPWFVGAGGVLLALLVAAFTLSRPIGRTREGMVIYEQAEGFKKYLRRVGKGKEHPPRDPESIAAWASAFGLADALIEVTEPESGVERRASYYPWWLFATTGVSQVQMAVSPPSSSSDSSSGSSGSSGGGYAGGGGGGTSVGGW